MWFNLVAADQPGAADRREEVSRRMTTVQIAEAQKLTRDYLAAHKTFMK
jgi:hypothetical protein